jgi:hypothetical protein
MTASGATLRYPSQCRAQTTLRPPNRVALGVEIYERIDVRHRHDHLRGRHVAVTGLTVTAKSRRAADDAIDRARQPVLIDPRTDEKMQAPRCASRALPPNSGTAQGQALMQAAGSSLGVFVGGQATRKDAMRDLDELSSVLDPLPRLSHRTRGIYSGHRQESTKGHRIAHQETHGGAATGGREMRERRLGCHSDEAPRRPAGPRSRRRRGHTP